MQKASWYLLYASVSSFWFFTCRATLLNHPQSSRFWSVLLSKDFFFFMIINNTFHIDIQVTYSKEQCNSIGWVLLWSRSECLRIFGKKDWLLIELQIPIFVLEIFWIWRFSGSSALSDVLYMSITSVKGKLSSGVGDKILIVKFWPLKSTRILNFAPSI